MMKFRTILHPTDFSRGADYAFRLAASLARDHGARLVVLHVRPPGEEDFGVEEPQEKNRPCNERLWEVFHRLEAVDPHIREVQSDSVWVDGDPAHEILRAAVANDCDLIVMGTHGRTGLDRMLMGSVTEKVLRKAPCPVLAAKAPRTKTAPESSEVEKFEEALKA